MKKKSTEYGRSTSLEEEARARSRAHLQKLLSIPPGTYPLKSPEMYLAERLGISIEEAIELTGKMGF